GALFLGKGAAQDRHGERHHERGTRALRSAARDQPSRRRRERTRHRCHDKQRDARGKHAPASEAVAECRTGQEQYRKSEIEGIDRPLQRFDGGAELPVLRHGIVGFQHLLSPVEEARCPRSYPRDEAEGEKDSAQDLFVSRESFYPRATSWCRDPVQPMEKTMKRTLIRYKTKPDLSD